MAQIIKRMLGIEDKLAHPGHKGEFRTEEREKRGERIKESMLKKRRRSFPCHFLPSSPSLPPKRLVPLFAIMPPLLESDLLLSRVEVGLENQGRLEDRETEERRGRSEKRAVSASRKKKTKKSSSTPTSPPFPPSTNPKPSPPLLPPDKLAETKKAERAQRDAHKAELAAAKQAKKQAAAKDKALHRDERAAAHAETKRAATEARAAAKKEEGATNGDGNGDSNACEHGVNHCKICRVPGREKEGKHGGK